MKTSVHLWKHLAEVFLEWEFSWTKVTKKIKTRICNSVFCSENDAVYEIMWKRLRIHCCIATATMITLTRQNITSCVHCLSCTYIPFLGEPLE